MKIITRADASPYVSCDRCGIQIRIRHEGQLKVCQDCRHDTFYVSRIQESRR